MLRALVDVLLPSRCPGCDRAGPGLCAVCHAALPVLEDPCPRCATPHVDQRCHHCEDRGYPHLAGIRCRWIYSGGMAHLVGEAKALGHAWAVRACADLLPVEVLDGCDAVVPVPASPGRRPGPHLGTALAVRAAARLGTPLRKVLRHTRSAEPQHRLNGPERRANVADLFRVSTPILGRILLVDDLLTSGATLVECARILRRAGAAEVRALVLARTPAAGEERRAPPPRPRLPEPDADH